MKSNLINQVAPAVHQESPTSRTRTKSGKNTSRSRAKSSKPTTTNKNPKSSPKKSPKESKSFVVRSSINPSEGAKRDLDSPPSVKIQIQNASPATGTMPKQKPKQNKYITYKSLVPYPCMPQPPSEKHEYGLYIHNYEQFARTIQLIDSINLARIKGEVPVPDELRTSEFIQRRIEANKRKHAKRALKNGLRQVKPEEGIEQLAVSSTIKESPILTTTKQEPIIKTSDDHLNKTKLSKPKDKQVTFAIINNKNNVQVSSKLTTNDKQKQQMKPEEGIEQSTVNEQPTNNRECCGCTCKEQKVNKVISEPKQQIGKAKTLPQSKVETEDEYDDSDIEELYSEPMFTADDIQALTLCMDLQQRVLNEANNPMAMGFEAHQPQHLLYESDIDDDYPSSKTPSKPIVSPNCVNRQIKSTVESNKSSKSSTTFSTQTEPDHLQKSTSCKSSREKSPTTLCRSSRGKSPKSEEKSTTKSGFVSSALKRWRSMRH